VASRGTVSVGRGDREAPPAPTALVVAAWVAVAVAASGQFVVTRRHHDLGWDLRSLYLAGKAVLHGTAIYDVPGFVYPPPAAVLGALLTWGPMTLGASVDLAVEIAVLVMLAMMTVGWLVPGRWRMPAGAVCAVPLLWSHPAVHGLWLGNVSVVMAGVGLAVVVAFGHGLWLVGCLVLGLSLLLKPLLLPLVLVPLLLRRFRPLLVAGTVSAMPERSRRCRKSP
jgi:arabinofuranan 3-O-arabinosyltransferase